MELFLENDLLRGRQCHAYLHVSRRGVPPAGLHDGAIVQSHNSNCTGEYRDEVAGFHRFRSFQWAQATPWCLLLSVSRAPAALANPGQPPCRRNQIPTRTSSRCPARKFIPAQLQLHRQLHPSTRISHSVASRRRAIPPNAADSASAPYIAPSDSLLRRRAPWLPSSCTTSPTTNATLAMMASSALMP